MSLGLILVIVLIVILVGGVGWRYYGPPPGQPAPAWYGAPYVFPGLGVILLILLILLLLGRI